MDIVLFPFAEYWTFYAGFTLVVLILLSLDLGVFHRTARVVTFRESLGWTSFWMSLALVFNYVLFVFARIRFAEDPRLLAIPGFEPAEAARQVALEFLTGYVIEQSLSVDNMFIFVVVFAYFGIPSELQHRVLFFGILGALIFRAIFIALGSVLMQYEWVIWVFGGFLILTGFKMFFAGEEKVDPARNPVIRLFKRWMPVTDRLQGHSFFARISGRWHATPLFMALLFLEMTDVIFAVDSVPAIFAITSEPMVVFTSNVFAILGLRSLYFLLAGAVDRFHMLRYGLALILIFVGAKMVYLNHLYGGKFPIGISLAIIAVILGASIVLSLAFPRRGGPSAGGANSA